MVKTRKIQYRLGTLDWIEVPTDWRKANGVIAKRTETNMGLAVRDYSIKCKTDSDPLMVVEGYWIWWCKTHNQPRMWCERGRLREIILQLKQFKKEIEKLVKSEEVKP